MAKDTDGLLLTASLDIDGTYKKIKNEDIAKLNAKLANDNSARVKIVGGLDLNKTQSLIQSQIATISKNLKLSIGQIDTRGFNSQASQAIGFINTKYKTTFDVISTAIKDAETEFKKFGEVSAISDKQVRAFNGVPEHFKKFTIQVKSATGEIQKFKYVFQNIGTEQNPSYKYILDNIHEADAGVKKLEASIEEARSKYTSIFSEFNSKYDRQVLKGLSTPIENFKTALDGLGKTHSINDVVTAFDKLKSSADKVNKAFSNGSKTDREIEKFRNFKNVIDGLRTSISEISRPFSGNLSSQLDTVSQKYKELQQKGNLSGFTTKWIAEYKEFDKLINQLAADITKAKQAEKTTTAGDLEVQAEYVKQIKTAYSEISKLKSKINSETNQSNINIYKQQIGDQYKLINQTKQFLADNNLLTQEIENQCLALQEQLRLESRIANNKAADKRTQEIKKYKLTVDSLILSLDKMANNSTFNKNSSNSSVRSQIANLAELKSQLTDFQSRLNNLNEKNISNKQFTNISATIRRLSEECSKAEISVESLKNSLNRDSSMQKEALQTELLSQKIKKLKADILAFKDANTKAMTSSRTTSNGSTFSTEIENMLLQLSHCANSEDFQKIAANFRNIKAEAKSLGLTGGTIFTSLWANIKKFSSWMSMTTIVSTVVMDIRNAIVELKEIDTILTEISKTSDRTAESLAKLGKASFDTASKYGQKASDYLLGVQEMSRAGFGETESEQMSELSTLAQSAGDMSAELANKYLIATNAAYKLEGNVEKLNRVLDGQNLITNRNALNMEDLADATRIVASQASNAGIGTDQLTAALGTMIASTQQSGSEMANAFKGILINIQQIKGYTDEETGETFDAEKLSKYEKACEAMGVPLKEMRDGLLQLRDPMTILEELADKYKELDADSTLRANLLSSVGGKYRANALDALLSNWDTYKKMLSEYNSDDAIGSAAEEAQKTAESWEGMFNTLKNDWTKFVSEFANTDLFKSLIESAQRFIDVLSDASSPLNFLLTQIANLIELATKFTDKIGLIPTILAGLSLKNVGELSLKYARSYATTDIKHRECNTF